MAKREPRGPTVSVNRRARYDYELLQHFDAGLQLVGTEIKAIRDHRANLSEGYARFRGGELWLFNAHIAPYGPARVNHEPLRPRKLLLHRKELAQIERQLEQNPHTTLIPLRLYFERGLAKVELALAQGRRAYDKRQAIAKRDAERAIQRGMRHSVR